jgi:hypothetical protein
VSEADGAEPSMKITERQTILGYELSSENQVGKDKVRAKVRATVDNAAC